jgi:DNA repair exonuclease SbcCD ATPase subunit
MGKDIKDLIDEAEQDQESRAYLEKTIEKLQAEVSNLRNKLEKQNVPFKIEPVKQVEEKDESEEIRILKNMVSSLRQELIQKDGEKSSLQKQIHDLTTEFETLRNSSFDSVKDDMIIKTQNSLNNLLQDYGRLETDNKTLKKQINELQQELQQTSQVKSTLESEFFNKEQLEKEVNDLKAKIYSLETANKSLINDLKSLERKEASAGELEIMVERLKANNIELEKENKLLFEKLEALKREKIKILKYESEISELKQKIDTLEKKNKELREKDSILLAKTITAISTHDRKEELKPVTKKPIDLPTFPETTVKEEKTQKPQKIVIFEEEQVKAQIPETPPEKQIEIVEPFKTEDKFIQKLPDETEDGSITRKWQCPNCGNANKAQIREQDDKTRVIYSYPKIYAKKYQCGQCGKEWR